MVETAPPKPRRISTLIWVLAGSVGFAALVFGGLGFLYLHDGPPPDDADLRAPSPIVDDDQNGERVFEDMTKGQFDFIAYAIAHGVDDFEANRILSGDASNEPVESGYLAQVQPALAKVEVALEKPYFEFAHPTRIKAYPPDISVYVGCGKTILMAARLAESRGDFETAVREITLDERLARCLADCHGDIVEILTAVTFDRLSTKAAADLLNNAQTPLLTTNSLLTVFQTEINWTPGYRQALRMEYQFFTLALLGLIKDPASIADVTRDTRSWVYHLISANVKVHQTLRLYADRIHLSIAAAELDYAAQQQQFAVLFGPDKELATFSDIFLPNGGGRYLYTVIAPTIAGVLTTKFSAEVSHRLVQTGLALRCFFAARQKLPGKLADLVPQYLPAIPLDPYNGQPLLYDQSRGLVYSVGTSLKDNHGSKFLKMAKEDPNYEDPLSDKEQPTLQLEFQIPPSASGSAKPAK